jgi:hypothetical protein
MSADAPMSAESPPLSFFAMSYSELVERNWTVDEIAQLLDTPPRLVDRWCRVGLLSAQQRQGVWIVSGRSLALFCGRKVEPFYSAETIAALLDNDEVTVRDWLKRGRLKKKKFGTARSAPVRVPESELVRWLNL